MMLITIILTGMLSCELDIVLYHLYLVLYNTPRHKPLGKIEKYFSTKLNMRYVL